MVRRDPTVKSMWRTIRHSLGRYLAIAAIIGLGSGFLAGLSVSRDAMVNTGDSYYRAQKFSDFTAMSTLGFTEEDVDAVLALDAVEAAEGTVSVDFLAEIVEGETCVLTAYGVTETVNCPSLVSGRLPESADECVLDQHLAWEVPLGAEIHVSSSNTEDTLDLFTYDSYTVVGFANSPNYLNIERGTTSLGDGTVTGFVYLSPDGFSTDYFTELYIYLGDDTPEIYSEAYEALADSVEPELDDAITSRADERYDELLRDASEEIADGEQELEDGKAELESERADGQQELDDAKKELDDGCAELDQGWADYESGKQELADQIASAEEQLRDNEQLLADTKAELEASEASYAENLATLESGEVSYQEGAAVIAANYQDYEEGLRSYEEGESAYAAGLVKLTEGKVKLEDAFSILETSKASLDAAEAQYAALATFQNRLSEVRLAINGTGYAFENNESLLVALNNAAGIVASEESRQAQLVYSLISSVLQARGLGEEDFLSSGLTLPAEDQTVILTAVNEAGSSYGIAYSDFAGCYAAFSDAVSFLHSADYQAAIQLTEAANTLLGSYVSDYDGSTGLTGFLTDAGYYSAVQDLLSSELQCGSALSDIRAALDRGQEDYEAGLLEYEAGLEEYQENEQLLAESRVSLNNAKSELDSALAQLEAGETALAETRATLDEGWYALSDGRQQLDEGWNSYYSGLQALEEGRAQLQQETAEAQQQLDAALQELEDGEADYASGLADYEEGLATFQSEIAEAEETIAENEQKLSDARTELDELEPADIYLLGRDMNVGYICFQNDTQIIAGISRVFPIFFFLVAALVCITTMTRMVEDDRTEIGTMKSLGYGTFTISRKYLIYVGSASLIGCAVGLSFGMSLIPTVIWEVYSAIYGFSDLIFYYDIPLALLCTFSYLSCALLVTWLCCRSILHEMPAELIRPKTPKAGKRVLLERVTFLWKRLSFLVKVSCRNVFRYKKRLFMMLVGIGGCTALLLTGFGIRDSIQDFINYQYEDISLYDCVVNFDESLDDSTKENFLEECGSSVEDMAVVHMSTVEFHDSELPFSANLVATDDSLEGFMDFHDGSTPLSYPGEGECLISRGISDQLNYQAGDVITVYDSDFNALTLTVTGVFDNYIDDYIYTTPDSILSFGSNYHPETAYVRYAEGTTASEVTAVITGVEHVTSAMDTASQQSRVNSMLSSIDYIVIMIVIFAAALAFIVLYNLTNINITERTREIATIQVLGFYPNETATYVFRENLMLSFLGAAVGLPLGKLLHSYVMHQVNVDGIYFDIRIKLLSYVGALALTLIFAWIVNGLMTFKLRRINMAESLKSVE